MPLVFKVKVLEALRVKGYTAYRLREDRILSGSTLQKLREGRPVSWENLETLCELLECQPGGIIEYVDGTDAR